MPKKTMSIGLSIRYLGYHAAGWRHPAADPGGSTSFRHFATVARLAEASCFDMLFLADGIGVRVTDTPPGSLAQSSQVADFEPLTLLSALSAVTERIGLVATASTTYNEPFHIARKYASLDRISDGRAGWNIVTSWSDAEARNFGRDRHLDYDTRYDRALECAEVVKGLWDSWSADALVGDKEGARFLDPLGLHVLNHDGPHFRVRGPLDVPRSPQGRPIMVQAGASDAGIELAGRNAEVIYALPRSLAEAQAYSEKLRVALERHGRRREDLRILAGITLFVGRTEAEARARYDAMRDLIPPELGLSYLYAQLGDLSGYPLDGPVPEPQDPMVKSIARALVDQAHRENMTIRDLYSLIASGFGSHVLIGTPESIVDTMEAWFSCGAVDGFNLCPALLPLSLQEFTDLILPELRRRGLFRTHYEGTTLREHLRLPLPASRYGDPVVPSVVEPMS